MNQLRDNLKNLGLSPNHIFQQVKDAISEDLAGGQDLTSVATITQSQVSTADFTTRASGVVSGLHVVAAVLEYCGVNHYEVLVDEGAKVSAGKVLITAQGNTQKLLLAERTALNFLSHLSGISTLTNQWVSEISGTKCQIRDTRKTTPGFRALEKWAVAIGGGVNHRFALYDMIMLKDNHIDFAGGITKAITMTKEFLKQQQLSLPIVVEARDLDEITEILKNNGVHRILIDNFNYTDTQKAIDLIGDQCLTESSGGIDEVTLRHYAECGVNYISCGALTHSVSNMDLSLKAV